MIALVLFILFGLLFGYFATINTTLASVHFGTTSINSVPMYVIVLASFAIGVLFAAMFYTLRSISAKLAVSKKEKELADAKEEAIHLTKKIHELEIENAKLQTKNGDVPQDEDSL